MADLSASSVAFISVLVAAGAVLASTIGVIVQYQSIKSTRKNTLSSLRVGAAEAEIIKLRDALSQYMLVVYNVKATFKLAMQTCAPYPGEHIEDVERETVLWHQIRLHLRPDSDAHRELLKSLEILRNDKDALWIERSDDVIAKANAAFNFLRQEALGQ